MCVRAIDQVVEAGAVHAGCGFWGTMACGLLHPTKGFFYTGRVWFLLVQLFGCFVIFGLAFFSTLGVALVLKRNEMLRVSLEEEEKGLDHKFGLAASAYHLERAQRIRETASIIRTADGTVTDLIEALQSLKYRVLLPFNPQASDLVIESQVVDILSRFDIDFANPGPDPIPERRASRRASASQLGIFGEEWTGGGPRRGSVKNAAAEHAAPTTQNHGKPVNGDASLSHRFKGEVSGAQPLSTEQPSRKMSKLERRSQGGANSDGLAMGWQPAPSPPPSPASKDWDAAGEPGHAYSRGGSPGSVAPEASETKGGMDWEEYTTPEKVLLGDAQPLPIPEGEMRPPEEPEKPIKWLAFVSHHKADCGDAARVFVDTARRVFGVIDDDEDGLDNDLIFLDSNNLSDLRMLLGHIDESANFILMLTRKSLERPWVLAELIRAHKFGKPILVVATQWPGDDSSAQGRSFKFPQHLDEAIDEWQEYYFESRMREKFTQAAEEQQSWFGKLVAGSVFLTVLKDFVADLFGWLLKMLSTVVSERPSNSSTWVQTRWNMLSDKMVSSVSPTLAGTLSSTAEKVTLTASATAEKVRENAEKVSERVSSVLAAFNQQVRWQQLMHEA